MESDATPRTPGSSVSFKIPPIVTWDKNHVTDEDIEAIENQEQVIGQIQDYSAARRKRRNPQKPAWLTTNMIMAYALLVIEDLIPSIVEKQKQF